MSEKKSSGLFNQFVKAARSTTTSVSKKTGEIVETTKVKVAMADLQNDIDTLYCDIGKLVYKAFADNTPPSEEINEKCALISTRLEEIDVLNNKLSGLKEEIKCQECGADNSSGSQFCSNCGAKLQ